ncbi:hypothetical protein BO99DRAFT_457161 [Aspergillus violaceofuscus CBS 115571]|uniref:Uncharacterized protein n=1 Tax=Aspergillus violaceofuscus (strain CBS 115571) TaxID=1450538 RepID=A0A2V5IK94_ASPV1|nr:hypothetical protein BO99DRAFT_457161 [Aspergillus violaceofuscus CBS 115571]
MYKNAFKFADRVGLDKLDLIPSLRLFFYRARYPSLITHLSVTMIETQVEIAAPPSKVREVLLDSSRYPEWHTSLIHRLEAKDSTKTLATLIPGDVIRCDIDGMKFDAEITENSENLFQWQGPPVAGLIAGLHSFYMLSTKDGSATILKQTEEFTGVLAFLMGPSLLGRKLVGQYRRFNADLKRRVEELKLKDRSARRAWNAWTATS